MLFRRATATTHRIGCGAARRSQAGKRPPAHEMAPLSYAHSLDLLALAGARSLIVRPLRSQLGKPLSPNGVRRPDADPIRKARFRESARAIVAKDRHDRKYGLPVDTAGAVARAMERAYREGFADAQGEPAMPAASDAAAGETIDWALIPPRPRTAFWTICLFILGKGERTDGAGHLVPATTERNTAGWQLIWPGGNFEEKPLGERTIVPLVRLGLLELADDGPERLLVSARGRATWWRFLERGGQYPEDLTLV